MTASRSMRRRVAGLTWKGLRVREGIIVERIRELDATKGRLEAELALVRERRQRCPIPHEAPGVAPS